MRKDGRQQAVDGRQQAEGNRAFSAFRFSPSAFSYFVWAVAAVFVLGFVSLVMVAPVARAHGHSLSAFFLYEMFSRVC
ncbi:MAG TPA: hypothetical protein VJT74_15095, partial [Pyrinomonadaceae bacterium]|nr:hypothetical protein [Pyrinomonadaceae bacterium]